MIQLSVRSACAALAGVFFCSLPAVYGGPATLPSTRAVREAVDRDEELRELLGEQQKDLVSRMKGRMEQSEKRLGGENDPGAQTQEIQRRIIGDIDDLIAAMEKNRRPRDGRKTSDPADGPENPIKGPPSAGASEAAKSAAAKSEKSASDAPAKKGSPDIRERAEVFMQIAPRAVPSVIEGATEQVSPKYRGLTEAYYKAVATAGSRER